MQLSTLKLVMNSIFRLQVFFFVHFFLRKESKPSQFKHLATCHNPLSLASWLLCWKFKGGYLKNGFAKVQLTHLRLSSGPRANQRCAKPFWPCFHEFAESSLPWLSALELRNSSNVLRFQLCSPGLRLRQHAGEFQHIGRLGA